MGALSGVTVAVTMCRVLRQEDDAAGWVSGSVTAFIAVTLACSFAVLACRDEQLLVRLAMGVFITAAVMLAVFDTVTFRLPNALVLMSFVIVGGLLVFAALTGADPARLARAIEGMATMVAVPLLAFALWPKALGVGDIKLSGFLGLVLAWHGWAQLLMVVVLGALAAAIVAPMYRPQLRIAWGPPYLGAAVLVLLMPQQVLVDLSLVG
ncbi:prepilin peptidase [Allokutzneria albata]|nr:prepilin peptidase [Allokutzneria albata]